MISISKFASLLILAVVLSKPAAAAPASPVALNQPKPAPVKTEPAEVAPKPTPAPVEAKPAVANAKPVNAAPTNAKPATFTTTINAPATTQPAGTLTNAQPVQPQPQPPAPPPQPTAYRPRWTSPTYKAVIRAEAPSSYLPVWHGNHFWRKKVGEEVVPQLNGWTEHIYNEIAAAAPYLVFTNPRHIEKFCPRWQELDREKRIVFWARLISAMATEESSLKPDTTYTESNGVVSTGLLQLSWKSTQDPHYDCGMIASDYQQGQKDLLDPKKNLSCGIRILNSWVGRDNAVVEFANNENGIADDEVWKGIGRYWAVFRHKRLKTDPEMYWQAIQARVERWQSRGRERDEHLLAKLREANRTNQPWTHQDWKAGRTNAVHPSLLEDMYNNEESHPLTSILRLTNQTAFCW